MIKTFVFSVLIVFIMASSCRQELQHPITVEKMEVLIMDIQMAETYSAYLAKDSLSRVSSINNKNIDSLALFYSQIFAKHNISKEQFQEAMKFYEMNPVLLDSIYQHINTKIVNLKDTAVK